jgi:hypothetical protein
VVFPDEPGDALERLEVGLGEHRLVVLDVLEPHRVPEPARRDRLDPGAHRDLGAPHGRRPAEQGALDAGGELVRAEVLTR